MRDLNEKVAYLRGLFEGADLPQNGKEKLIWDGMLNFCEDVAREMRDLGDSSDEFAEYIEAIDEDLSVLEKHFYDNFDDGEDDDEAIFTNDREGPVIELVCPNCHEELSFTAKPGDYEVVCPECGRMVWSHATEESVVEKPDLI